MRFAIITILLCSLFLLSCNDNSTADAKPFNPPVLKSKLKDGWSVESQGWFDAGHNNNAREIVLITAPNGKKYLCVTGASIEEWTTAVQNGKTTVVTHHEE